MVISIEWGCHFACIHVHPFELFTAITIRAANVIRPQKLLSRPAGSTSVDVSRVKFVLVCSGLSPLSRICPQLLVQPVTSQPASSTRPFMIEDKNARAEAIPETPYIEHCVARVDKDIIHQSFDKIIDFPPASVDSTMPFPLIGGSWNYD